MERRRDSGLETQFYLGRQKGIQQNGFVQAYQLRPAGVVYAVRTTQGGFPVAYILPGA